MSVSRLSFSFACQEDSDFCGSERLSLQPLRRASLIEGFFSSDTRMTERTIVLQVGQEERFLFFCFSGIVY